MVRSRPGSGHYYFRQSVSSIAMGNRQASDQQGELWSARVADCYVVGPLSEHPDTGKQYEVINDAPIVEAPQWLIDFCMQNDAKETNQKTGHAELDDESPVYEGARDNTMASLLGKARQLLRMEKEELFQYGMSVNQRRFRPPLSEKDVRRISGSIGGYEIKPTGGIAFPEPVQTPVQVREIETESVNPSQTVTEGLDWLPVRVLASTRLQDIYSTDFEPYGCPLSLALPALVNAASVVVPPMPR